MKNIISKIDELNKLDCYIPPLLHRYLGLDYFDRITFFDYIKDLDYGVGIVVDNIGGTRLRPKMGDVFL